MCAPKSFINIKILFLILCVFFSTTNFSQTTTKIRGKVLDKTTQLPVSYATILLKKNSLGLYANEEGDFLITNSLKYQSDTIIISSIGYKKIYAPLKSLSKENINKIYLHQVKETLDEITIVSNKKKHKVRSKPLIKEAIKRIPQNYPTNSFSMLSYYRDYLKRNGTYYNLNEAIIQTIDSGFLTPHYKNSFRLLSYKSNPNFTRETFIPDDYDSISQGPDYQNPKKYVPYAKIPNKGGNELFILLGHDPLRNYNTTSFSFINKLKKDFIKNHNFKKPIKIYQDEIMFYKVPFTTQKNIIYNGKNLNNNINNNAVNAKEQQTDMALIEGEIVINPKDYTIHQIKYKAILASTKKQVYELRLEYGYVDNTNSLMRLNYVSFNNEFFTIDKNDEDYFKIESYARKDKYLTIKTNAVIDAKNATNKSLYNIYNKRDKIEIKNVKVVGNEIRVFFKHPYQLNLELKIDVRAIKDINGRIINQKKLLRYYQFRELFVQQYNKKVSFTNQCFMQNVPLDKNCISKSAVTKDFLLNSPFQKID